VLWGKQYPEQKRRECILLSLISENKMGNVQQSYVKAINSLVIQDANFLSPIMHSIHINHITIQPCFVI